MLSRCWLSRPIAACLGRRGLSNIQLVEDITGCAIKRCSPAIVSKLNESIMGMMFMEPIVKPTLLEIVAADKSCGIAHILLINDLMKNSSLSTSNQELIDKSFHELNRLLSDNEITEREKYLAAALFAWRQSNYNKCGMLAESALLLNPLDAIAMKLAQDAYLAAGNPKNALGCVARVFNLFQPSNVFHGHVLGMLSLGYLENNKLYEAEEVGTRAVASTKGADPRALNNLLHTYHLSGKSSEISEYIERFSSKHEDSNGFEKVLYNKGLALIQRGNYFGALKVYDQMIQLIQDEDMITQSLLVNSTFLILQISIHSTNKHILKRFRDEKVASAWLSMLNGGASSPLVDVCAAISFSHRLYDSIEGEESVDSLSENDDAIYNTKFQNMFSWLKGGGNGSTNKPTPVVDAMESKDPQQMDQEYINDCTGVLLRHQQYVQGKCNAPSSNRINDNWSKIEPSFALNWRHSIVAASGVPDEQWVTNHVTLPLIKAISCFTKQEYSETATILLSVRDIIHLLGCSAVQMDVFEQMIIESLLRSNQLVEAKILLSERTVLNPNDAQAWRRLASIYGRLGERELASSAHYTAWQLGIGQGGFLQSN